MTRTHRDLPPIPTDPAERRRQIQWLMAHPAWTHPAKLHVPPDGYCPPEGNDLEALFQARQDWPAQDIEDGHWSQCIDISVVYVNPATEEIDDDGELNTALRVWLEAGPWFDQSEEACFTPSEGWNDDNKWTGSHDINLDCGAEDIETALLELARLVRFFYDEGKVYRQGAPVQCDGSFEDKEMTKYRSGCRDAGDGFCSVCGFEMR